MDKQIIYDYINQIYLRDNTVSIKVLRSPTDALIY